MRKGETLEQEAARRKAEAELPGRIKDCTDRLSSICDQVREMTVKIQKSHHKNMGGEKSGTLG